MAIELADLEREADRWTKAAHQAALEGDSSISLWRAAAARAQRELEVYRAGFNAALGQLPIDMVEKLVTGGRVDW